MLEGLITKGIGGLYKVNTKEGIYQCKARGLFRKEGITPYVGDKVLIRIVSKEEKEGYIHSILVRKNELNRPKVVNVDQVCIVFSCDSPKPDFNLIDKIILSSLSKNINIIVCENKKDLCSDRNIRSNLQRYEKAGFETFSISAIKDMGLKQLIDSFKNKKTVFAGQSGVGKSSIINKIMKEEVMEIGELSTKIDKGKHTTRHVELIWLKNGGYIIDTPGFSNFELDDIEHMCLDEYYPEFEEYMYKCKHSDCCHINQEGCKVIEAVKKGEINENRYRGYVENYKYLKKLEDNKYR